jgi:protein-S-isoprenylcysteine O-methyltransferase Ste14
MSSLMLKGASRLAGRAVGRAALVFLPAGRFGWWQGWVYVALVSVTETFIALWVIRRNPALATRRLKGGARAEERSSQRVIMAIMTPLSALLLVIPALDHRFGWSELPIPYVLLGEMLVFLALLTVFAVFRENTFAGAVIKVVPEQTLVATGPYSWVRHPMYSGLALFYFGIPLALGSAWGLGISILLTLLIVLRLLDEEKLLRPNLAGYSEYCRMVPYRLVPGIW